MSLRAPFAISLLATCFLSSVVLRADNFAYIEKSSNNSTLSLFDSSLHQGSSFGLNLTAASPVRLSSDDSTAYLFAYRAYPGNGQVFFAAVNLATQHVQTTLALPSTISSTDSFYLVDLLLTPDGRYLWATVDNHGSSTLLRVDLSAGVVTASATSTTYIYGGLALSPDGSHLLVSSTPNVSGTQAILFVLDTASASVVRRYPSIPAVSLVLSPDGGTAYLSDNTSQIEALNLSTGAARAYLPISRSTGLVITPAGDSLYTGTYGGQGTACSGYCLAQIRTTDLKVTAAVPLSSEILSLAISPDGNFLAAVNSSLLLFHIPSLSPIGEGPSDVSKTVTFAHGSNSLFVTGTGSIAVVDLQSATKLREYSANPTDLALSADGTRLYLSDKSQVLVLDPQTGNPQATIDLPEVARSLAISPDNSTLYAAVSSGIARIDTASNQYINTFSLGVEGTLTVSLDGSIVYLREGTSVLAVNSSTGAVLANFGVSTSLEDRMTNAFPLPDGTLYALSFQNGSFFLYHLTGDTLTEIGEVSLNLPGGSNYGASLLSPDRSSVLIVNAGALYAADTTTGASHVIPTPIVPGALALSSDNRWLVTGSADLSGKMNVIHLAAQSVTTPTIGGTTGALVAH